MRRHCNCYRPWCSLDYIIAVWQGVPYNDVTMGTIASQIISLTIVYSIVYSDADQRKHQSSASLAFVRGIHRGPVNSPHKWPVTRNIFPFDDVIMGICLVSYIIGFVKEIMVFTIFWQMCKTLMNGYVPIFSRQSSKRHFNKHYRRYEVIVLITLKVKCTQNFYINNIFEIGWIVGECMDCFQEYGLVVINIVWLSQLALPGTHSVMNKANKGLHIIG